MGNLGACVRVAAAAVRPACSPRPARSVASRRVRGGAGLQFALAVGRAAAAPSFVAVHDLADAIHGAGRPLLALDPEGDTFDPRGMDPRAVLAFGTERDGLTDELLTCADARCAYPCAMAYRASISPPRWRPRSTPGGWRPDPDWPPRPTGHGIGSPARAAIRFRAARSPIAARVRSVAEPMFGSTIRLGAARSGSVAGSGSGSVTSRPGRAEVAGVQGVSEGLLVDQRAPRRVDEDRARPHRADGRRVDQVARLGGERCVQADDVGPAQCGVQFVVTANELDPHPESRPTRPTACPIRPAPTIAMVAPASSRPSSPAVPRSSTRRLVPVARLRGGGAPRPTEARGPGRQWRRSARRAYSRARCRGPPARARRRCRTRRRTSRLPAAAARRRRARHRSDP